MQYQVPQFIDIEDKIVGPLTLKQFFYVAAAFLINFFTFFILKFFIWLVFALIVSLTAVAFAFVKYNGRSFFYLIRSLISYYFKPRTYSWRKTELKAPIKSNLEEKNLSLSTFINPLKGEKPFRLPFLQNIREREEKYEVFRKTTGEREVARKVDYK